MGVREQETEGSIRIQGVRKWLVVEDPSGLFDVAVGISEYIPSMVR